MLAWTLSQGTLQHPCGSLRGRPSPHARPHSTCQSYNKVFLRLKFRMSGAALGLQCFRREQRCSPPSEAPRVIRGLPSVQVVRVQSLCMHPDPRGGSTICRAATSPTVVPEWVRVDAVMLRCLCCSIRLSTHTPRVLPTYFKRRTALCTALLVSRVILSSTSCQSP